MIEVERVGQRNEGGRAAKGGEGCGKTGLEAKYGLAMWLGSDIMNWPGCSKFQDAGEYTTCHFRNSSNPQMTLHGRSANPCDCDDARSTVPLDQQVSPANHPSAPRSSHAYAFGPSTSKWLGEIHPETEESRVRRNF